MYSLLQIEAICADVMAELRAPKLTTTSDNTTESDQPSEDINDSMENAGNTTHSGDALDHLFEKLQVTMDVVDMVRDAPQSPIAANQQATLDTLKTQLEQAVQKLHTFAIKKNNNKKRHPEKGPLKRHQQKVPLIRILRVTTQPRLMYLINQKCLFEETRLIQATFMFLDVNKLALRAKTIMIQDHHPTCQRQLHFILNACEQTRSELQCDTRYDSHRFDTSMPVDQVTNTPGQMWFGLFEHFLRGVKSLHTHMQPLFRTTKAKEHVNTKATDVVRYPK